MRRFLYIMLSFALYLLWGVSGCALSEHNAYMLPADSSAQHSDTNLSHQPTLLCQCVATPTLTQSRNSVANASPSAKIKSQTSRASARHKAESDKIFSEAIHSRRAGHLTHIFEYDYFRSSLRVVYYLHTLCRLRI